jgi:hypothetical protein
MKLIRKRRLALLFTLVCLTLACRTMDTIAQLNPTPTVAQEAARKPTRVPTKRPKTQSSTTRVTPTAIVAVTDEPPPPTIAVAEAATEAPPPTRVPPRPTERPPDTEVPSTPTPQWAYLIQESRCGPNVRTYIEGFVYENGIGKNDVLVRISQGPDGQPDPNPDFHTGDDKSKSAGYYYQNIDANAPHSGTWYLWVIDPANMQRISEISIVKTDPQRVEDSGNSAGSCQSATVNFSNRGGPPPEPTQQPSVTRDPNATPTHTPQASPTCDPIDDSC